MGFITATNVETGDERDDIPFAEIDVTSANPPRWADEDRDSVVFEWNGEEWLMMITDDYTRYQADELVEPN